MKDSIQTLSSSFFLFKCHLSTDFDKIIVISYQYTVFNLTWLLWVVLCRDADVKMSACACIVAYILVLHVIGHTTSVSVGLLLNQFIYLFILFMNLALTSTHA